MLVDAILIEGVHGSHIRAGVSLDVSSLECIWIDDGVGTGLSRSGVVYQFDRDDFARLHEYWKYVNGSPI